MHIVISKIFSPLFPSVSCCTVCFAILFLIRLFKENESIDKSIQESVFPRLVVSGNLADIDPLYIAAEGRVIVKLGGLNIGMPMALALLMGTFYIFNIEYPTKARNTYVFLEATFLENKKKAKKRVVIQKLPKELV